jgi:hypothetical protein
MALTCGSLLLCIEQRANAFELITTNEAARPDDETRSRGITRGPQIVVTSPPPTAGVIRSPFNLKIRFEGRGGVNVDPESVVISYKKKPLIDLTQRCAPFINAAGITINGATAPPGTHTIRVDVRDQQGRVSWSEFSFQITP